LEALNSLTSQQTKKKPQLTNSYVNLKNDFGTFVMKSKNWGLPIITRTGELESKSSSQCSEGHRDWHRDWFYKEEWVCFVQLHKIKSI